MPDISQIYESRLQQDRNWEQQERRYVEDSRWMSEQARTPQEIKVLKEEGRYVPPSEQYSKRREEQRKKSLPD